MVEAQASKWRQVSLRAALVDEAEDVIKTDKTYGSIAELVTDSVRRRLEQLKQKQAEAA